VIAFADRSTKDLLVRKRPGRVLVSNIVLRRGHLDSTDTYATGRHRGGRQPFQVLRDLHLVF
jgi:hypothetical protein